MTDFHVALLDCQCADGWISVVGLSLLTHPHPPSLPILSNWHSPSPVRGSTLPPSSLQEEGWHGVNGLCPDVLQQDFPTLARPQGAYPLPDHPLNDTHSAVCGACPCVKMSCTVTKPQSNNCACACACILNMYNGALVTVVCHSV